MLSLTVWCSISALSSAPSNTITTDSQIHTPEADPRAERTIGFVVTVEVRDVPRKQHRRPSQSIAAVILPAVTQRHFASCRLGP